MNDTVTIDLSCTVCNHTYAVCNDAEGDDTFPTYGTIFYEFGTCMVGFYTEPMLLDYGDIYMYPIL